MGRPGDVDGRHFTTYVEDVKRLKKEEPAAAERLLLRLVDATEAESEAEGYGVAPWYYAQLAILYSKRKDYPAEVAILARFASQKHAPGVQPPKLLARLQKAKAKLDG